MYYFPTKQFTGCSNCILLNLMGYNTSPATRKRVCIFTSSLCVSWSSCQLFLFLLLVQFCVKFSLQRVHIWQAWDYAGSLENFMKRKNSPGYHSNCELFLAFFSGVTLLLILLSTAKRGDKLLRVLSTQVDKECTKSVHSIPLPKWAFYHCSVHSFYTFSRHFKDCVLSNMQISSQCEKV